MSAVGSLMVRIPGLVPQTLGSLLDGVPDLAPFARLVFEKSIAAGQSFVFSLPDGRGMRLERRGDLVVGTPVVPRDPVREAYLAQLAVVLRPYAVPGGDVVAWLAHLPTEALAVALLYPPERAVEVLFTAAGMARAERRDLAGQDLYASDFGTVVRTPLAEAALRAWAGCTAARLGLAADMPYVAVFHAGALRQRLAEMPERIARQFAPIAAARLADAVIQGARHASDEVA